MKLTTFFTGLLLSVMTITQAVAIDTADSLKQVISLQKGEKKLDAIYDLIKFKAGGADVINHMDWLEQEARKQGNENYTGAALLLKTTYYMEKPDLDSMLYFADLSKVYSLEHKQYDRYFLADNYVIQKHIENGSYELAQLHITQMLDKARELNDVDGEMNAYECMGMAYIASRQPEKAIEPVKKAIELQKKHAPDRKLFLMDYYLLLIQASYESKNYTESLAHCQPFEQLLADFDATKKGTDYENLPLDDYWLMLETFRSMSYTALNQPEKAKEALEKAAFRAESDITEGYHQRLNLAYADYYYKIKDNSHALSYLEKAIHFHRENASGTSYIDLEYLKSDILADMGQYKDAFTLRKQMNVRNDSLERHDFSRQIQEIRTIYEVDKMEAEALMKEAQYRNRLTLVMTVAILSLLALAVILYFYRKKQLAYRELVRKGQQWAEIIPPMDICTEVETETINGALLPAEDKEDSNQPDVSDLSVMEEVELLMKEKKLYIDPQLTLDSLSETLNMNRYYLSKAINRCNRKNFSTYINEYRIKEAIRIMSDEKRNNLSIDGIAYESGFSDRASFYRTFKKMTGLPPATFRSNLQAG